ncbi:MAG: hypothetical protein ABEK50_14720 [bacterium]
MSSSDDRDPLTFRTISVRRMPGVEPPGLTLEDFDSGINVIHGPNAAGKTTVARAFNALLWPDRTAPDGAMVNGEFTFGESNWFVEYNAGRHRFERDGTPVDAPPLPAGDQIDRYNLALHDLLQEETTNSDFAEFIVQELSGGYDLSGAAESLGFKESPSGRGNSTRRVEDAVEELNDDRKKMSELKDERRRRRRLEQELSEVEEARRRLEYLEQLRDWYTAREDYREQKRLLEELPDVMEDVSGDETETLEDLQSEINQLEQQEKQANDTLEEAEETVSMLDYPYEEDATSRLQELRSRHETLKDHERDIASLEKELEAVKKKRRAEAKNLGDDVTTEQLDSLDRAQYDELSDLAREYESAKNQLESFEKLKTLLTDDVNNDLPDPATLKSGCDALENWLSSTSGEEGQSTPEPAGNLPLLVGSVAIAGLSVTAGALIHIGFYALLALPLILHWWAGGFGTSSATTGPDEADARSVVRKQYERLELEPSPDEWTREAVRSTLDELYDRWAEATLNQLKQQDWARRRDDYGDLQDKKEEIDRRRDQFAEAYGFAPEDARMLHQLTNRLRRWQDAHSEVLEIEEFLEQRRSQKQDVLETLEEWNLEETTEAAEVADRLKTIETRIQTFNEAEREKEQARDSLDEVDQRLPELREKKAELFRSLDLEPGNETALREFCERHEAYRDRLQECNTAEGIMSDKHDDLTAMEHYRPDHEEWDRTRIDQEIEEVRTEAERYDEIKQEITEITTRIEEAKQSYEVEPALAEKQRALDALREQFEEDCEAMIGNVLCEYVQSVNTDRTMPAVFERARELFSRITSGNYKLVPPPMDEPAFRVKETRTGRSRSLNELSSGTRVQVLMAVRLAFVEQGEDRGKLPIYMDETLANADDEKAHTIIESTQELARSGRQIFYFTAQGDEVAKWQAHDGDRRVIDLSEHISRTITGSVEIPDPDDYGPETVSTPSADGLSHEEYGEQLDVPPLDPRQPVGSVHLWYLVEDTDCLEDLLSRNLMFWGPLENLLDLNGPDVLGPDHAGAVDRIRELAAAVETFMENWQHGRNRRIDRSVLEETDAVSDNFIDDVAELAEDCDGDPEELVERLRDREVSGFMTNKMDELEHFLQDKNYIDRRESLDQNALRAAVISSLNETVFENPTEAVDRLLERINRNLDQ